MTQGLSPAFLACGPTTLLAATTTAQAVALTGSGDSLRIANPGSVSIRVAFGCGAADALAKCIAPGVGTPAASLLMMPGEVEIFAITSLIKTVAVMTTAGTAAVELTRGDGN